jgi:hypothetical protein
LAPEQIRDPHDVDFRADVYSLGAVLYELLTGSAVYAADAAPALLAQVAADAAPSLRNLRPDAPGELDHIVLRCLAKNRSIRYPSLAELVLALAPFASDEATSSIERIVRLGKRTSKLPERAEERAPSALPSAPPSVVPPSQPAPARGRHGTVLIHTAQALAMESVQPRRLVHDDVTTINPYAGYAAPVVISPVPPRTEPFRTQAPRTEPLRTEVPRSEPPRTEPLPLRTPQPPPLRASVPPPLRASAPPPLRSSVPPPLRSLPLPEPAPVPVAVAAPASEPPAARPDTTSLPPPRSSVSGLTRSWAVPDEPSAPLFTQRRLIAVGAIAACAALGAVLALRHTSAPVAAAAAPPPVAAPARVEPPPPAPAPAPAPVEAAPVASVAASAVVAPAAAAPVAAAPVVAAPAPAAVAPAPVAAVAPRPVPVAAPAAPVVRRSAPKPREDAPVETAARKPAATEQKVASSRPASGGDLFDDMR